MEKILITGTGRCGTTFLIKLFSFLDFNTGYNRNNYSLSIYSNCNSGMERSYKDNYNVLKSPLFIKDIKKILEDTSITITNVIIPIRDLSMCAKSRVKHGLNSEGGLWEDTDELSQINFYQNILSNYLVISTKYDINTIFIDFDNMIHDKTYLFNKLKNILDKQNIDFETFSRVYDEVSLSCKP